MNLQALARLPVIDSDLVQRWEERLQSVPEVEQVAVVVQDNSVRSNVQYELGNVDRAMSDSRTAMALDQEAAGSMLRLAVALYAKGDRQESLRLAEKAIRWDRNIADLQYLKERGWGDRLLSDTQIFFNSPKMQGLLKAAR